MKPFIPLGLLFLVVLYVQQSESKVEFQLAENAHSANLAPCKSLNIVENCWIQPCSVTFDFDGDGKEDHAYLVSKGKEGPKGIAILLDSKKCFVAGAGKKTGNGGDNFDWMDQWKIRKAYRGKKDGLSVTREGIGGVLYLKKESIVWKQEGD